MSKRKCTFDKIWPLKCEHCTQEHSAADWEKLEYLFLSSARDFPVDFEHRRCSRCGLTISQAPVLIDDVIEVIKSNV